MMGRYELLLAFDYYAPCELVGSRRLTIRRQRVRQAEAQALDLARRLSPAENGCLMNRAELDLGRRNIITGMTDTRVGSEPSRPWSGE